MASNSSPIQKVTCYYPAHKERGAKGTILGIPGFTHHTEETRADKFLGNMATHGYFGILPHYDEVRLSDDGSVKEVICDLTPQGHLSAIEKALSTARELEGSKPISVLASSVGAWFLAHYLASNPKLQIENLILLSPMTCYSGLGKEFSERLNSPDENGNLDISTGYDKANEAKRTLTEKSFSYFRSHSPYNRLRRVPFHSPVRTATFIGLQDKVVTPHSMAEFHRLISIDSERGKIHYLKSSDHDIPYNSWAPIAERMFL